MHQLTLAVYDNRELGLLDYGLAPISARLLADCVASGLIDTHTAVDIEVGQPS